MRSWWLVLLMVGLASRVHADDDEEGGDYNPPPQMKWRVSVDMDVTYHNDLGDKDTVIESDSVYSFHGRYVTTADAPVPGVDVLVALNPEHKYTVESESGTLSSNGRTALPNGNRTSGKAAGTLIAAAAQLDFHYHARSNKVDATVRPHYTLSGTDGDGQPVHGPTDYIINLSNEFGPNGVTLTRAGNRFTVDYVHDVAPKSRLKETVHLVIEPAQDSKYVAVIRPVDRKAYATWLPLGPTIPGTDETKGGNTLDLLVEVRDKATNKPVAAKFTAVWTIESSKLPGWCMNYPKKAEANDHWDLYFAPARNKKGKVDDEGESLHSEGANATVSSRDYGAHGMVKAVLTLSDGEMLVAHEDKGSSIALEDGIAVPKDDNHNHIADDWEIKHHVAGKPAAADDDAQPAGMFNKGDGIDLFEEYRGFAMLDPDAVALEGLGAKTVYRQLDPDTKELFVAIEARTVDKPLVVAGVRRYAGATGVRVLFVPDKELLEPMAGDLDSAHPRTLTTRVADGDSDFGPAQAAVWITTVTQPWTEHQEIGDKRVKTVRERKDSSGYTSFVDNAANDETQARYHGSPTQIRAIEVFPENVTQQVTQFAGWFTATGAGPNLRKRIEAVAKAHPDWNFTVDTIHAYATAHIPELASELLSWTVMHELGHATGARHHNVDAYIAKKLSQEEAYGTGDEACPMLYWHMWDTTAVALFMSGHWKLLQKSPSGADWKFCAADWPDMRIWQDPDDIEKRGKH